MHFFVRFAGSNWQLEGAEWCKQTVLDLQHHVFRVTAVPVELQRLTYGTRHLEPARLLQHYGIVEDATVHVLVRGNGGNSNNSGNPPKKDEPTKKLHHSITHDDATPSSVSSKSGEPPSPPIPAGQPTRSSCTTTSSSPLCTTARPVAPVPNKTTISDPSPSSATTNNPAAMLFLRIKKLTGEEFSLGIESLQETVGSLKQRICDLNGLECTDIKLVYKTQALGEDDATLESVGIRDDEQVHVVLMNTAIAGGSPSLSPSNATASVSEAPPPAAVAAVAKKPFHCAWDACLERHAKVIGDCGFCSGKFCARHRLPESHHCQNIQSCKQISFDTNRSKVMNGKCIGEYVL